MNRLIVLAGILALVAWMACDREQHPSLAVRVKQYHLQTITDAAKAALAFNNAVKQNKGEKEIQSLFRKARLAYKRTEFFTEYYSPLTAKSINGAPIPEIDVDDQHRITMPEGFQVIESYIFPSLNKEGKANLLKETAILNANFKRLESISQSNYPTNEHVFDAFRLEIFRVLSMGISGFDAPLSQNSVHEAAAAISSLHKIFQIYADTLQQASPGLYKNCNALLLKTQRCLEKAHDFNSFNRMEFITACANPLSKSILQLSKAAGIKPFQELRALKTSATTLFDADAFNPDFYTYSAEMHSTPDKINLGKALFFDPVLSGNGKRSCASCHQPQKAFADGLVKNKAINSNTALVRNTPTVLNSGLQPALFYDVRVAYLEDQANEVIKNPEEMHGSLKHAVQVLKQSAEYQQLFSKAFDQCAETISALTIKNAIASYVRSLNSLNSPFDKYVRGDKSQLSASEINGFNLFMGKAKCGTCHFTPLFNGNVPPNFQRVETEIIGVPVSAVRNAIDTDPGKYNLRHLEMHRNAFRTPTLRNIALTAPYMHNGIYSTLEEVLDFYNEGGGIGLGIKLENQTLPFDKLSLSKKEKSDIVAFLKKLNDTGAAKKVPETLPKLSEGSIKRKVAYTN